jgi:uncharacterized protein YjbI with pentapeptide repeats
MKNKINSRSVRMTAVNTRETTAIVSLGSNNTTLSNADVKDYSGMNFSNVTDFSKYSFIGAILRRAVFDNLDINQVTNFNPDFTGADLTGASFYETTMPNANFQGAIYTRTSFIGTKMPNANFQGATITTSIFDGADLSGANFSNLTMTDVSFYSANLTRANFSKTIIKRLYYSEIDFNDANFTAADFSGANFDYSEYNYANFTNANFTSSKINGSFTGVIFNGTIFKNATLSGGTFQVGNKNIAESQIFNNVDFSNANLEKISFSYYPNEIKITLRNVDFTGASFSSKYDIFFDDDANELAVIFENTKCRNGKRTNFRCY